RANQDYLRELIEPDDRHKIKLVYHGVDLKKFSPGVASIADPEPLILAVGRLVEKKGLLELLDACGVLQKRGCAFRCLIVGEGPQREALEARIEELGLSRVVGLPGARSQEELVDFYRRATVFTLPCKILANGDRDGLPNVLMEAMAVGVPVVATAVSGIPEVVQDGENGLLLKEVDAAGLADALESLLQDPDRRRRLATGGRTTVEKRFDTRSNVRALVELLSAPEAQPRS
ncbi:MAG: glycosyltransferase family 4 protein, partial [Myxococcota bacterium]